MPFDSLSTSDPHPDWHDLLAGYALGNLSPEEQATLQQILTDQPELQAEVQAYEETLALVPYALAPQPLPPGLEDALITAAQTAPKSHSSQRRPQTRQHPRQRWYQWATAAAVLIATIVGTDNYRLRQQQTRLQTQIQTTQNKLKTSEQELAQAQADAEANPAENSFEQVIDILRQPNALVYSLQGTGDAATSSGSLLTLPNHSEVQLVSHNLPVLPADKVYRLWSVATEQDSPMFCGQFNNTEVGNVQWTVPDALCNAKPVKVIITIDAVIDPPVPKGPAVLTGNI
ncbi:MAG: anti-sigma factor [Leptolyngbyaceae cyanobacterium MAG.088]|nr:anti-sigma factor [Leptolyngbyaceae cyanobacterium MAG.088]